MTAFIQGYAVAEPTSQANNAVMIATKLRSVYSVDRGVVLHRQGLDDAREGSIAMVKGTVVLATD
jgi:hypothetical protein